MALAPSVLAKVSVRRKSIHGDCPSVVFQGAAEQRAIFRHHNASDKTGGSSTVYVVVVVIVVVRRRRGSLVDTIIVPTTWHYVPIETCVLPVICGY